MGSVVFAVVVVISSNIVPITSGIVIGISSVATSAVGDDCSGVVSVANGLGDGWLLPKLGTNSIAFTFNVENVVDRSLSFGCAIVSSLTRINLLIIIINGLRNASTLFFIKNIIVKMKKMNYKSLAVTTAKSFRFLVKSVGDFHTYTFLLGTSIKMATYVAV